jgi:Fanconi anemia group M protein
MFLLQGLPGVGRKRAASLLDAFGSVEAVMGADTGELVNVEGIGTTTAEAIRWVVGDEDHSQVAHED